MNVAISSGFDWSIVTQVNHRPWPIPTAPWLMTQSWHNLLFAQPGVYFFSLDAGQRLAVAAARTVLNLPYFSAVMTVETRGDTVVYHSVRDEKRPAVFEAEYSPTSRPFTASKGSLGLCSPLGRQSR